RRSRVAARIESRSIDAAEYGRSPAARTFGRSEPGPGPLEVRPARERRQRSDGEAGALADRRLGEEELAREEDRRPEAGLDPQRRRAGAEGREAAGERPRLREDRPVKAGPSRGEGVEIVGIEAARAAGEAAAERLVDEPALTLARRRSARRADRLRALLA